MAHRRRRPRRSGVLGARPDDPRFQPGGIWGQPGGGRLPRPVPPQGPPARRRQPGVPFLPEFRFPGLFPPTMRPDDPERQGPFQETRDRFGIQRRQGAAPGPTGGLPQAGPRPVMPGFFPGAGLAEMRAGAEQRFGALSPAEQARQGGFWNPLTVGGFAGGAQQVMRQQFQQFTPPQAAGGLPQAGPRPVMPGFFPGAGLAEMRAGAEQRFGALSPAEQARQGGFWNPLTVGGFAGGAQQVMRQQFQQFTPPQAAGGLPAPGGAPGGFGVGGQDFGAMQEGLAQTLFEQTMAPVAADFGRRGLASSSMFGAATARASAEAQMNAFTQMEQMRRTGIAERGLGEQIRSSMAREELERELMKQNWNVFTMQLDAQGDWQNIAAGMEQIAATPPDVGFAPPFRPDFGPGPTGGFQQAPSFLDRRQTRLDERQQWLDQQERFRAQQDLFQQLRPRRPTRLVEQDIFSDEFDALERRRAF